MAAVLVVEDDEDIREAMVELLEDHGYEAISAANGLEALDCMRAREDICVVLLDLSMPIMDGWECCESMAKEPRLAALPVILLSGTSSLHAEREELGAAAILPKPFEPNALIQAVARHRRYD